MNPLLQLVLSLSLGGSLMALLVLGIQWTLRGKLPSAFYYCAWLLVLLRLVLPLPGFLSLDKGAKEAAPTAVYDTLTGGIPHVGELPTAVGIGPEEGGNSPVNIAENTAGTEPAPAQPVQEVEAPVRPGLRMLLLAAFGMTLSRGKALILSGEIWLWLWAAGALATLLWYIVGYRRFGRTLRRTLCRAEIFERHLFRQMGGPERLRLCRSTAVGTPMLLGLWRPVLVLPEREYSEEMLKNIFRHELTHYRRGDLAFKWLAVLVSAIHWFNPVVHMARRQLDRACEMSCDERLLRQMDTAGKRSYGETLLTLAAYSLPRRLVATTFATEKRNLKERLEQIMTYQKMSRATLALLLVAALLLGGCAAAVGPQTSPEPAESPAESAEPAAEVPTPTPEAKNVTVSTVDELLSAIGSYTNITLLEGEYNLAQANDYGQLTADKPYHWQEVFSTGEEAAFELMISGVDCLTLLAEGEVTLSAVPRYANVLVLDDCTDICLAGLTIGHTEEPGQCVGGVVKLNRVDKAIISQCRLFGCGTVGVNAEACTALQVVESEIYDCSYSAAQLSACQNVLFNHCKVYDNTGFCGLFQLSASNACAVINSRITGNNSPMLLDSSSSQNVYFAGNEVSGNDFSGWGLFNIQSNPVTVEGCAFTDNQGSWYAETSSFPAVDSAGNELRGDDLAAMTLQSVDHWEASIPETVSVSKSADGMVHVSTVDEFLAAIASDTEIYLEDGVFDLSTASNYGAFGGANYVWYDTYVDGPQLVISGVKNLSITGGGADRASIQAVPRYAEVLAFENCQNITLKDFTAGHTQAPGHCTGGVVYFANSSDLNVEGCSLYGCGVWGITLSGCENMTVKNTEIYDCSYGDLNFASSKNIRLENCNIHDNGMSRAIYDCQNVTLDGTAISSFSPPDYETLNARTIDLNPWEMPAAKFYINYLYSPISELTLTMNTPIELYGRFWGGDADADADLEVKWSLSGSSSDVKLTERKHGKCTLENISGKSGEVTLTAECQGQKASITVYLTGSSSAAAPLRICFYEKELTEFTVRRGDAPIELNAQMELNAQVDQTQIPEGSSFTWTSSDPDCLEVIPNGSSCTVKILKARPEGVTLTCKAGGYETQVTAYIIDGAN
ncbi:MAG: M56 family metallopeptidase [Candidatus Limivicinus sp.]